MLRGSVGWLLLAAVSAPTFGQLNQNCTVSALNRNVQVRPDGTWLLPNVPVNQGRVRARATCLESGVTRFGQSDLLTVPLNGAIEVAPIRFGPTSPIPDSLTLTATSTNLTQVGATSQIATTAHYPNGTTADITQFSKGTNYVSSNDVIATVSPDGLVRAVSNGSALITAFNEGVSGFISIRIGIPPQITMTSPVNGETVTQGGTITVTTQVTGGGQIQSVALAVNGQTVATRTTPPFQFVYMVPLGVSAVQFVATVRDVTGNVAVSQPVTINAVPDPLTTVTGRVEDSLGNGVSGATVMCLGVTGTSSANGNFSIANVPTTQPTIVCLASIQAGPVRLTGSSAAVAPVRSGVTNVGTIILGALSSRGTEFWLAHQNEYGSSSQLFIVSDTTATFTVSGPSGFTVTDTVTPSSPKIIPIPSSAEITTNQFIENKGLRVTSDAEISITLFYPTAASNDTYLAIPVNLLGTEYFAMTYLATFGATYPAEFVVISPQDNTQVTITPTCTSISGSPAGTPINITLNRGQTYQYMCSTDVTGSRITSSNPVAVVSGVACTNVPIGSVACDVLSEMMFPVSSLYGTEFYTAPLPGNAPDLIRVLASQDNTTVTVNSGGAPSTFTLNRGNFQELRIKPGTRYTSDKPITVVQFAVGNSLAGIGDPMMMQIVPTAAFRTSHRLFTPSGFAQGTFVTVVAPNAAVASVQVNGAPVATFASLPGGTHQFAVVPVVTAQTVVTASQPIGVYGIGFTAFGSYGHPAGF